MRLRTCGTSATAAPRLTWLAKSKEYAASINLERWLAASGASPCDVPKLPASSRRNSNWPKTYAKVASGDRRRMPQRAFLARKAAEYIQSDAVMTHTTINYAQNTSDINRSKAELACWPARTTRKNRGKLAQPRIGNPGKRQRLRQHRIPHPETGCKTCSPIRGSPEFPTRSHNRRPPTEISGR